MADELDQLYRAHRGDVERYVARRIRPTHVEDICQDVWLAAREALPRYRHACPPKVWLRILARNKVVDLLRRKPEIAMRDSSLAAVPEVAGMFGPKPPTTPTKKLARVQAARRLEHALAAIGDDDRELLELRFVDGLKPADIAQIVDARANTVSQRIVRVVNRLRQMLAEAE